MINKKWSDEVNIDDASVQYNNAEANAWVSGYNNCREKALEEVKDLKYRLLIISLILFIVSLINLFR